MPVEEGPWRCGWRGEPGSANRVHDFFFRVVFDSVHYVLQSSFLFFGLGGIPRSVVLLLGGVESGFCLFVIFVLFWLCRDRLVLVVVEFPVLAWPGEVP